MILEAVCNCESLNGGVDAYYIGNRVVLNELDKELYLYKKKLYEDESIYQNRYFNIGNFVYNMNCFVVIDIDRDREEKINKILENDIKK